MSLANIKASGNRLEPSDFPFLSLSNAFNTTVKEISEVCRSELEMESVRSARKLFLADWSSSELSSEEIFEENMLEISCETINYVTARQFAVTVMLLIIVSLVIHYYVITYNHVITKMNNKDAIC